MYLKTLLLCNFRNFAEEKINFSPKTNVIYGENAQGKTNVLEAIYFLSTGRSFRTNHLEEIIQKGKDFFYIEAEIVKDNIAQHIKIHFQNGNKKVQYNATQYATFSPLLGVFPTILYSPEDIDIITGAPILRRRAINIHLAMHDPLYIRHLSRFTKAMKHRNALLRDNQLQSIDCWDEEMAISASYLTHARKTLFNEISPLIKKYYSNLSQKEEFVDITYSPSISIKEDLSQSKQSYVETLKKNRLKELEWKSTLIGPHKDDFTIQINNLLSKSYSSEGQKRSIASSFRFAEWERLSTITEEKIPISIDDFGMQLDANRRQKMQNILNTMHQVFITAPEPFVSLQKEDKSFYIEKGKIVQ